MNAKEFNLLLEKYNVGHLVLKKDYESEGDNYLYPHVVDNDYNDITDGVHFTAIDINDSTFNDLECEGEITEDMYEEYDICDLQFYTTSWAYPEAYLSCGDSDIDDNCGIRLIDFMHCHNVPNQIDAYAEQALKAYIDPQVYQSWLLDMFNSEMKEFNSKHWNTLKEMGFKQLNNGLFKRGFGTQYESEIYIEFETNAHTMFIIHQNMFTGKLVFNKCDNKPDKNGNVWHTEINVNDLTTEELKAYLDKLFDRTGELFWREHSVNEFIRKE